ncbi:hypothetical protein FNV43_RR00343 [Rhamnella rubrinervis]|uniref:Uncharacterized protein n=1 Tax=Rhamnella rubrinervis TaxID=2594499 RepID=A0A8K0HMN1_9ROSA|nr:hypothetical protein FNV43_RR00343 [Rhamnella rubrinervis]
MHNLSNKDLDTSSDESLALKTEPLKADSMPTLNLQSVPSPTVPIHIITSKYASPINVIAYMGIGAHRTMMNPKVLPPDTWIPHTK